ncbi:MAG: hypothetical protein AB7F43_03085 [Bacteriovoracia bacterium]
MIRFIGVLSLFIASLCFAGHSTRSLCGSYHNHRFFQELAAKTLEKEVRLNQVKRQVEARNFDPRIGFQKNPDLEREKLLLETEIKLTETVSNYTKRILVTLQRESGSVINGEQAAEVYSKITDHITNGANLLGEIELSVKKIKTEAVSAEERREALLKAYVLFKILPERVHSVGCCSGLLLTGTAAVLSAMACASGFSAIGDYLAGTSWTGLGKFLQQHPYFVGTVPGIAAGMAGVNWLSWKKNPEYLEAEKMVRDVLPKKRLLAQTLFRSKL